MNRASKQAQAQAREIARALGFASFRYAGAVPFQIKACFVLQWPIAGQWEDKAQFDTFAQARQAQARAPFARVVCRYRQIDGRIVQAVANLPRLNRDIKPAQSPRQVRALPYGDMANGFESKPNFVVTKKAPVQAPEFKAPESYQGLVSFESTEKFVTTKFSSPEGFFMVSIEGEEYFLAFSHKTGLGVAKALTAKGYITKLKAWTIPDDTRQAFQDKAEAAAPNVKRYTKALDKALAGGHYDGLLFGEVCQCHRCRNGAAVMLAWAMLNR